MSSWFTEKVSSLVKESVPLVAATAATPVKQSTADELANTLEQRARGLTSPQSAAWLLSKWVEQSANPEVQYSFRDKDRHGHVWHLTFYQVLLRSYAFEMLVETCSRVPQVKAALSDTTGLPEGEQLRAALHAVVEIVLLPGAIQQWPVLLDASLSGDDGGGPLPWGSWSRRMVASLKRSWRGEALPKNLQQLDAQLTAAVMAAHAESVKFAEAASSGMTMSAAGGQMSRRRIRTALIRRQIPQCAAEAVSLRRKTELLCEMCERLDATSNQALTKSKEVERLLADADVACKSLEPGMKDLDGRHEEMGKSFSDVGSAQQQQIAIFVVTQESLAKRRRSLDDEHDKLTRRLQEIEGEVLLVDDEARRLSAQVQQLRAQFNLNVGHYDGLLDGSLSAVENLSGRKTRAVAFQECARAAAHATNEAARRTSAELAVQLKRRQAELRRLCAAYVQKERSRLELADQCLAAASEGASSACPAAGDAGGGTQLGDVGEEVAEAVASAQDAWRCAQATLQRVDQILVDVSGGSGGDASHNATDSSSTGIGVEGADASAEAADFFAGEAAAGRRFCVDCSATDTASEAAADWASVSHGTYLCMDCAGRHRGLGVHLSFVRSVIMDRWTRPQLQRMRLGGSVHFREFLSQYPELVGVLSSEAPSSELHRRYESRAAEFYRRLLAARCGDAGESHMFVAPSEADGHLPALLHIVESPKAGAASSLKEEREHLEAAYAFHQRQLQDALVPGAI